MLFDLRVTVPDRPGALARLTALVADHGIDVRGIEVLGSSDDGVIDHLLLECEPGDAHGLTAALSTEVRLRRPGPAPLQPYPRVSAAELDFLLALADNTHLGVDLFTDAIPRIFAADWAHRLPDRAARGERSDRPRARRSTGTAGCRGGPCGSPSRRGSPCRAA